MLIWAKKPNIKHKNLLSRIKIGDIEIEKNRFYGHKTSIF